METPCSDTATKLELLEQKLSLILRLRDLTASARITGSGAEEGYISLIARREAIIKQLKALDICLSGCAPENGEEKLIALIKVASSQVLELDGELNARIPVLMKDVKNRLKQVKNGRSISRAYHTDAYGIYSRSSYSLKQ